MSGPEPTSASASRHLLTARLTAEYADGLRTVSHLDASLRLIRQDHYCLDDRGNPDCPNVTALWAGRLGPSPLGLDIPHRIGKDQTVTYVKNHQAFDVRLDIVKEGRATTYAFPDAVPGPVRDLRNATFTFRDVDPPSQFTIQERTYHLVSAEEGRSIRHLDEYVPAEPPAEPPGPDYFPGADAVVPTLTLTHAEILDEVLATDARSKELLAEGCLSRYQVSFPPPQPGIQLFGGTIAHGTVVVTGPAESRNIAYTIEDDITGPKVVAGPASGGPATGCGDKQPKTSASQFLHMSDSVVRHRLEFDGFIYSRNSANPWNLAQPGEIVYYLATFVPDFVTRDAGTQSYQPYQIRWNAITDEPDMAILHPDDLNRMDRHR